MAYFSNSTEGSVFDYQCSLCKYGEEPCPIAAVQSIYNYDACNNEIATKFKAFKKDFSKEYDMKNAPSLFDVVFGNSENK